MGEGFLVRLIVRWVVATIAIYIVSALLYPHIIVEDFATAIWAGLVLGLLNAILRPLLIFFTLPATIFTLGLFLLVINAFIFVIVGALVEGVRIEHFGWAFLGALLISIISTLLNRFIYPEEQRVHIEIRR